jgi:hypothetical protein
MIFIIVWRLFDEEKFFTKNLSGYKSIVKRFNIVWCRLSGRRLIYPRINLMIVRWNRLTRVNEPASDALSQPDFPQAAFAGSRRTSSYGVRLLDMTCPFSGGIHHAVTHC